MINIKITMVDDTEYNVRNIADSVKDAFKRIVAPYGTNMSFVEIIEGTLISVDNIVSIREMNEDEVIALNTPQIEEEEVIVGLNETEVEVEGVEEKPEVSQ